MSQNFSSKILPNKIFDNLSHILKNEHFMPTCHLKITDKRLTK